MQSRPEIEETFAGWLYRPYVDLGPRRTSGSPLTIGLELAAKAFTENDDSVSRSHGTLFPSARRAIVRRVSSPSYQLDDPRELAVHLRTPAWQKLCDTLDLWNQVDAPARARALWLLHRMGLHQCILTLGVPDFRHFAGNLPTDEAAVYFLRGLAKSTLFQDGELPPDLSDLEFVAESALPGTWAHIEATYFLAQVSMKALDDVHRFQQHLHNHELSIGVADESVGEPNKLRSRFHRIKALLPQLERDNAGMVREMDLAEQYCDQMPRGSLNAEADWQALRWALLESRTKEQLVLGDIEAAEKYARAAVDHAPVDPSARLILGQVLIERDDIEGAVEAYRWAAILGPHVVQIAEFMIGQCCERLGRLTEARQAYAQSLQADPLAISAIERLAAPSPPRTRTRHLGQGARAHASWMGRHRGSGAALVPALRRSPGQGVTEPT